MERSLGGSLGRTRPVGIANGDRGVASLCFLIDSLFGFALVERVGSKKLLVSRSTPRLIEYWIHAPLVKNRGPAQLWAESAATRLVCVAFSRSCLPV